MHAPAGPGTQSENQAHSADRVENHCSQNSSKFKWFPETAPLGSRRLAKCNRKASAGSSFAKCQRPHEGLRILVGGIGPFSVKLEFEMMPIHCFQRRCRGHRMKSEYQNIFEKLDIWLEILRKPGIAAPWILLTVWISGQKQNEMKIKVDRRQENCEMT
jgi:hypothetical protein